LIRRQTCRPLGIAQLKHPVNHLRCGNHRVPAVPINQQVGRTVDV
jgi:hypothetical protein